MPAKQLRYELDRWLVTPLPQKRIGKQHTSCQTMFFASAILVAMNLAARNNIGKACWHSIVKSLITFLSKGSFALSHKLDVRGLSSHLEFLELDFGFSDLRSRGLVFRVQSCVGFRVGFGRFWFWAKSF